MICLVGRLFRWPRAEAESLLRAVRSDAKGSRPDYIARTLALVYGP
jgi:hypothetical protein